MGLRAAGIDVVAGIDNWTDALSSYSANHRTAHAVHADISQLDPVKFMSKMRIKRGQISILKTCPPCQPFSTLGVSRGRRRGLDLVVAVADWVDSLRPSILLLENVPGLQRNARYSRLVDQLGDLGYATSDRVVDAADFGVAQHRRRLVLVGLLGRRSSIPESFWAPSTPVHIDASKLLRESAVPGGGLDSLNRHRKLGKLAQERVRAIPPGGSRFDLPDELQLDCHKRLGGRSASAAYGRIALSGPSGTMTTRCTSPSCGRFVHPTLNRGLTLREAAILQGFGPDYQFRGSYGSIERQIGNAVPPSLVQELASRAIGLLRHGY